MVLAAAALGISAWGVFMVVVTNQEKISSSVVKQIMRSVREDARLKEVLGEAMRPQPEWWLNGDPKIHGRVRNSIYIFASSRKTSRLLSGDLTMSCYRSVNFKGMLMSVSGLRGRRVRSFLSQSS